MVEHTCPKCQHVIRRKEADNKWMCFDLDRDSFCGISEAEEWSSSNVWASWVAHVM